MLTMVVLLEHHPPFDFLPILPSILPIFHFLDCASRGTKVHSGILPIPYKLIFHLHLSHLTNHNFYLLLHYYKHSRVYLPGYSSPPSNPASRRHIPTLVTIGVGVLSSLSPPILHLVDGGGDLRQPFTPILLRVDGSQFAHRGSEILLVCAWWI